MTAAAQQYAIAESLIDVRAGMPGAMDRLVPLVYADLSRIAHRQLASSRPDIHCQRQRSSTKRTSGLSTRSSRIGPTGRSSTPWRLT